MEGFIVQLRNETKSSDLLFNTVASYYQKEEGRKIVIFDVQNAGGDVNSGYFIRFLLDRKHVVEYRIANDRNFFLSIILLAIGPHYFSPADFWDYENSRGFSLEATTEAVVHNLKLLDEFLAPLTQLR
jgi:hypothetical protein